VSYKDGLLAMYGAEEFVLGLEVSAECGGSWVCDGQRGKAVEVRISVTLDADETAEGGDRSTLVMIAPNDKRLYLSMIVSI
jgi:hypothetical protein